MKSLIGDTKLSLADFKGKKSLKGILDFALKLLNANSFSAHTDQKLGS